MNYPSFHLLPLRSFVCTTTMAWPSSTHKLLSSGEKLVLYLSFISIAFIIIGVLNELIYSCGFCSTDTRWRDMLSVAALVKNQIKVLFFFLHFLKHDLFSILLRKIFSFLPFQSLFRNSGFSIRYSLSLEEILLSSSSGERMRIFFMDQGSK